MDIKKSGSGIWFVIHTLALNVKQDKHAFEWSINTLCDNFGCDTCKPHFRKFIDEHPLKNFNYKNEEVGYFKWTWELHNDINKRLNKPTLSFDDALSMYKSTVCKNCNSSNITPNTDNSSNTPNNKILIPIETLTLKLISR